MRFNRTSIFLIVFSLIWIPIFILIHKQLESYEVFSIEWNRSVFLRDIMIGIENIVLGIAFWRNKQRWFNWISAVWLVLGIFSLYSAGAFAYRWMGGNGVYIPIKYSHCLPPSQPPQSTTNYPTLSPFTPPASWKVYKTDCYQYAYPPTWSQRPESNYLSNVSAPSAKYPNGYFTVLREADAAGCDKRGMGRPQDNPSMHQETITISGYPAVQFEGKSRVEDGYYDRKQVLIGRGDTCFLLEITGRDNPEQWTLLNEILATFKFTGQEVYLKKTDLPSDDNGSGGITITSEQNVTNYEYNGIGVTAVNGIPATTAATPR